MPPPNGCISHCRPAIDPDPVKMPAYEGRKIAHFRQPQAACLSWIERTAQAG
jgi:hypothetical protein